MNFNTLVNVIRGIVKVRGGTDNTIIGNTSSSLNTHVTNSTSNPIPVKFPPNGLDAFGRLRVSHPQTLFETTFRLDKQPLLFSESVVGGGVAAFNTNKQSVDLSTTTANGDSVIFQSRRRLNYHPGKSHLILLTGNLGGAKANCRRRAGLFDTNNGVFFELDGTIPNLVVRSSVSGSVVDTKISQSNWNLDKLDGTGASGINVDWSKQQLLFVDFQWLGSGTVRYGTIIGGNIIYAHEQHHANSLSVPWAQNSLWPIRVEITNTGAVASSTTMHFTCASVISEGGWGPEGILRTTSNDITSRAFGIAGSTIPILSIRKQSAYQDIPVRLMDAGLFCNSSDDFVFKIVLNGTLTGASWSNITGICQRDVTATAISGGQELYSAYVRGGTSAASTTLAQIFEQAANVYLGSDVSGTSDILSIVGINVTATANASAFINYKELY